MNREIMTVSYTPDGDTLRCWRIAGIPPAEVRIRLAYLDAPEMSQAPYGLAARAYLRGLLRLGERVQVQILGQDVYGRLIGEVRRVRDEANCGLRLVAGGYAAVYSCPAARSDYVAAQALAQQKHLGIWERSGPWQTPWRYR